MNMSARLSARAVGTVVAVLLTGLAGCDLGESEPALVSLNASALSGTSCDSGAVDPFADIASITIAIRGTDPETGDYGTLVRQSVDLGGANSIRLKNVPEGRGHDVIIRATGASGEWFARDPAVDVRRNTDNPVDLLFSRVGAFSCVAPPGAAPNTLFPAAVNLGDGRVLVTGGFTAISATELASPTREAFLFDSRTGQVEALANLPEGQGRAGHAMVYMPSVDQVLIVGGFTRLRVDESQGFPFVFTDADVGDALNTVLLFDVASKEFRAVGETMSKRRGFPRAALLADDTVVITGGGPWPFHPTDTDYQNVEVYDPEDNDGAGGFLDVQSFRSFHTRAGHTLSPLDDAGDGLSELLVWGGTSPERGGRPAEVLVQSGRQRDLVDGTFREVVIVGDAPAFTYFHETTPLLGGRFLVTGGSAVSGGAMQAPAADEAWLLTYVNETVPTVQARRVPGFGAGRVFHSAASADRIKVALVGGLSGTGATSAGVMYYNLARPDEPWSGDGAADALFAPRGGHGGVMTPSGAMFFVGGEGSLASPGAAGAPVTLELFAPRTLPEP